MNFHPIRPALLHWVKARPKLAAALGLALLALVLLLSVRSRPAVQPLSSYEVKRGDFLVSVVEGGTLESVNEISIRSEVEGTARIIFIVPEGSYVKKGDLLVELDSSSSQDQVNQQQINVEKAQFALVQAEQQLDIQKSVVDSETQAATLKVEFAESDLEKFVKGQALQAERNAQIEITNTLQNLQIAQERLDWSEKLFKQGFETKGNLDKDRLTVLQTKLKLEQTQKALWMVETFDNPKTKRSLEASLQEAKENLDRVKLQGERKLAQYKADLDSQKRMLELSQIKLDRDKKQLLATKMYAPQDGLVVYAGAGGHWSSESLIEEGAVIRNRQEIIKLPDITEMKVQIKIHESHINQVRLGQCAFVVLDSMPDLRFQGVINKVAPLPDSQSRWGNPDLKVYATEILITDALPDVKPGVSARAEVVITNLNDVLSVPIQAVTTRKGKQVVFLASAPEQPVPVTVGQYNTKFIQVAAGLREGDRVLLSPPFDVKEKDLGGAIVADDETLPAAATNRLAGAKGRAKGAKAEAGPVADLAARSEGKARHETARPEGEHHPAEPQVAGGAADRKSMEKRFDTDGDGKLNDTERGAMQEWLARRRGTNAPAAGPMAKGPVVN